jgi:hypothetical protein
VGAPSSGDYIYVNVKLKNVSSATITASTLASYRLRYYYVAEGTSGDASFQYPASGGSCFWAQPQGLGRTCDGTATNCYFQFALSTVSVDLAPGQETASCSFAIESTVVYTDTNDFSYGSQTAFPGTSESLPQFPWVKIPVYDSSGSKILGVAAPY